MPDHSACAGANQPSAEIAAARAIMESPEPVDLPDQLLRQEGKRLLWRLWCLLSADERTAFLAWAAGGADAPDR